MATGMRSGMYSTKYVNWEHDHHQTTKDPKNAPDISEAFLKGGPMLFPVKSRTRTEQGRGFDGKEGSWTCFTEREHMGRDEGGVKPLL